MIIKKIKNKNLLLNYQSFSFIFIEYNLNLEIRLYYQ